jgi:alginate O-acetyltransferase complex protein AlgI
MLFNSYAFLLVFLPAAIVVYRICDPNPRLRMPALIVLSLVFYAYWDIRFLPLIVASIGVNWLAARAWSVSRNGAVIIAAIVLNLAVLGVFKYLNFFVSSLSTGSAGSMSYIDVALPLGISFFTFHHIMYLVDLRRGTAPAVGLDRYALYICFFPQVLSGPLVRWSEVFHQFGESMMRPGWQQRCATGVILIVWGLVQKTFLGDRLAEVANPIFTKLADQAVSRFDAFLGIGAFTFQIYFDFSGYSDIAIGLALVFGIVLPANFDAPYRAASIRDFWRRWHMTLSRFLRDFVYVPLGGNRHGMRRQLAAVIATMALGGLWHGAGWTFVAWGLLHGVAICAAILWSKFMPPMPRLLSWAATFCFVAFAWVFFRAGSFDASLRMIGSLLGSSPGETHDGWRTVGPAALCALVLPASPRLCDWLTSKPRVATAVATGLAGIAVLIAIGREQTYEFIYFRF